MSLDNLEVKRIGSKVFITIECGSIEEAISQEGLYKQGFAQTFSMLGSLMGGVPVIEGTAVKVENESEQRERQAARN